MNNNENQPLLVPNASSSVSPSASSAIMNPDEQLDDSPKTQSKGSPSYGLDAPDVLVKLLVFGLIEMGLAMFVKYGLKHLLSHSNQLPPNIADRIHHTLFYCSVGKFDGS